MTSWRWWNSTRCNDITCFYRFPQLDGRMLAGQMKQVSGGVGRNIADALGRFGHDVCFLSAVGGDSNGDLILKSLGHIVKKNRHSYTPREHCNTYCSRFIFVFPQSTGNVAVFDDDLQPTSWCVVLQDRTGDCVACIGDMGCHERISIDMVIFTARASSCRMRIIRIFVCICVRWKPSAPTGIAQRIGFDE